MMNTLNTYTCYNNTREGKGQIVIHSKQTCKFFLSVTSILILMLHCTSIIPYYIDILYSVSSSRHLKLSLLYTTLSLILSWGVLRPFDDNFCLLRLVHGRHHEEMAPVLQHAPHDGVVQICA